MIFKLLTLVSVFILGQFMLGQFSQAGEQMFTGRSSLAEKIADTEIKSPNRPFAKHNFSYFAGVIEPQVSQSELDKATIEFYNKWKSKYLKTGECGAGKYFIFPDANGDSPGGGQSEQSISISEGHGYGMIIVAYMAGVDPNAKKIFDGLYRMFKAHPSQVSPYLMAWNQVKGCKDAPDGGDGPATDGDIDIAYALLLADKQWGSDGDINYLEEAKNVIKAILDHEVHHTKNYVQLYGDVENNSRFTTGTRTSDFIMNQFRAFGKATGEKRWELTTNNSYAILDKVQYKFSSKYGLVPDFIEHAGTKYPIPARLVKENSEWKYLEGNTDNQYSYNACRVPWRLGIDYLQTGDYRAYKILGRLNEGVKKLSKESPDRIKDGYKLSGQSTGDSPTMSFVAPLVVSAMIDKDNQKWLNKLWQKMENTPLEDETYYGNSLKMLSMIAVSRNWWVP